MTLCQGKNVAVAADSKIDLCVFTGIDATYFAISFPTAQYASLKLTPCKHAVCSIL